jgi:hypothetical protein
LKAYWGVQIGWTTELGERNELGGGLESLRTPGSMLHLHSVTALSSGFPRVRRTLMENKPVFFRVTVVAMATEVGIERQCPGKSQAVMGCVSNGFCWSSGVGMEHRYVR